MELLSLTIKGNLRCRGDWFEMVEASIEEPDETMLNHIQWQDVK
jgi:hypothetical protein